MLLKKPASAPLNHSFCMVHASFVVCQMTILPPQVGNQLCRFCRTTSHYIPSLSMSQGMDKMPTSPGCLHFDSHFRVRGSPVPRLPK